jgi:hypothetical protein
MGAVTLATEAILLTRKDSGEHGALLTFLSPSHGLLRAFNRSSARSRQPVPDLFDEASLRLEKPKTGGGDLWFVHEYLVQRRRGGLGANYHCLLYACRYGLLLAQHIFDAEEAPLWTEQLRQTLDAWEKRQRPEATYFKAIYLFARLQGIPVKEEWLASRSQQHREMARAVLRQPLPEQTTPMPAILRLIADFEHYLENQHDVRISDFPRPG